MTVRQCAYFMVNTWNQRLMEKHGLEGTFEGYLVQTPAQSRAIFEGR